MYPMIIYIHICIQVLVSENMEARGSVSNDNIYIYICIQVLVSENMEAKGSVSNDNIFISVSRF